MRVIVIDAKKLEVREEELDATPKDSRKHLDFYYKAIGCDTVDCVRVREDLDLWVDDEGLYANGGNPTRFILIKGYPNPLAGSGVLMSHDNEGNSIGLPDDVTLDEVKKRVAFLVKPE